MWAAFNGQARQVEVLELLVAAGADLAAKNTDGCRRAVGRAQREHTHPSASPTVGDRWTALMLAAKNGHVDAAAALIFAGADINATSNDGYERPTPRRSARSRAENVVCHTTCDPSHSARTPGPARRHAAEHVAGRFRKSAEYAEAVRKVRRASCLPAASDLAG
jgi:hypothetical protein